MSKRIEPTTRPRRAPVQVTFTLPSKTRQDQAELADINQLVRKYTSDELVAPGPFTFGDVTQAPRLEDAVNTLAEARTAFEMLPAHQRQAADSDYIQFYQMLADPEGQEILRAAGVPSTTPGGEEAGTEAPATSDGESDGNLDSPDGGQEGTAS